MYASVVHFSSFNEVAGRTISDGRPLKSARKYRLNDEAIVLRAFESDDRFALRVTRGALGGEVLFEGVVQDGQHMRIYDSSESFWSIAVSRNEMVIDPTNQGGWIDEAGRLRVSDKCNDYEGEPETALADLIPNPERELPPFRDARGIVGSDIRFLVVYDGGFFEGDSTIEVWYVPCDGCYRVRFWHDHGERLSRRRALRINPPETVSLDEMNGLIAKLMELGLADTYSGYCNRDVLDGGGWGLTIGTRDGYDWSWGGYNAYPRGWDEARDAICELLLGYPSRASYDGHTAYIAEWHEADGDLGRTDIAHLYRHGVDLSDAPEWRIPTICARIRQDILLYRRTRRSEYECRILDDGLYAEVLTDVRGGKACRRTTGELMGAVSYIVDHDDATQTNMKHLALDGTLNKLLCNVRVRDKAAPGLAVTGWEV